tara:strand:+ start:982 stop:1134 length:153 start_codon:yes stop_codon:yes gene_type:complete
MPVFEMREWLIGLLRGGAICHTILSFYFPQVFASILKAIPSSIKEEVGIA